MGTGGLLDWGPHLKESSTSVGVRRYVGAMQKRRDALRVAGWIGMLAGAFGLTVGALVGRDIGGLIGSYALLLIVSGAWAVVGLELVERRERRSSRVPQPAGTERRGVVGR
jgi:hypothetical protein